MSLVFSVRVDFMPFYEERRLNRGIPNTMSFPFCKNLADYYLKKELYICG